MLRLAASTAFLFLVIAIAIQSQPRVTVFPFNNVNGKLEENIWSYELRDSLETALKILDPNEEHFVMIPAEEVDVALASVNFDPSNPQWESDMWKVAEELGADKVILGNFDINANRYLINAYIIHVKTKLRDPNQARDIFKKQEDIFDSIPIIVRSIKPGLIAE